MFRINLKIVFMLVVSPCVFGAPPSESAPGREDPIAEIVVTAHPLGETATDLAQPVQVLTKEALRTRSIRNIGETLARELGVSVSDFGPGAGRPVIRGQGGSRVSVMENGVSTLDVSTVSADHAVSVETVFASQLEILRGPATLLYGSAASGGVVNLVNDRLLERLPTTPEGELSVRYETVSDGVTGAGSLNLGVGPFAIHIDGMARDTDDYSIPGFAERVPDEGEAGSGFLENSSIETENVAGGLSYIGSRGFVGLSVSHFTTNYGVPGHGHDHGHEDEDEHGHEDEDEHGHEDEDEDEHGHEDEDEHEDEHDEHEHEADELAAALAGGPRIDMTQTRYDLKASLDDPLPFLRQGRARWTWNDYDHDEVESDGALATTFTNEAMAGRVELIHNPLGRWSGAVGMQYRNLDFAAVGEESFVMPSSLESIGVFALETGRFGPWKMDLGLRYERQDTDSDAGAETRHNLFSVSGGVSWEYASDSKLGLAVSYGQRAPSIEQLYADGPHLATSTFEIGDIGLKKESAANIDLSWRKIAGPATFAANVFHNRIDDFISLREQDLNGDGVADRVEEDFDGDLAEILPPGEDDELLLMFQTQVPARFTGFELETVLRALDDRRGVLDLRVWTDYTRGKIRGGGNLPRITPWRIGASLSGVRGPWRASIDYVRVDKQTTTAPLETATSGYHMLSLQASYTLNLAERELVLFARGANLLNEEARRHTSFIKDQAPLPGRSGIFGMRFVF